jgi:hypothetical protein
MTAPHVLDTWGRIGVSDAMSALDQSQGEICAAALARSGVAVAAHRRQAGVPHGLLPQMHWRPRRVEMMGGRQIKAFMRQ